MPCCEAWKLGKHTLHVWHVNASACLAALCSCRPDLNNSNICQPGWRGITLTVPKLSTSLACTTPAALLRFLTYFCKGPSLPYADQ